ncbi:MAG: 50S ribosomal protein L30 [Christensenellaceae bacterium]|jgi:large subunit ribosomal protein L30|nr:50S ribosomal protein L30 [Christensenellaceae bacterium]
MEKKTKTKKSAKQLKVTYLKSAIGFDKNQKAIIEALGFTKLNTTKVFPDNACIRGSLFKVKHLVQVEEIKE